MIATTPYELEIVRRVQAGELCPSVLKHGDLCGRAIDASKGDGLCSYHSEDELGLQHAGDTEEKVPPSNVCTRCQKRPVAFRVTRLCGNCHKVMHRQHTVESGARKRR